MFVCQFQESSQFAMPMQCAANRPARCTNEHRTAELTGASRATIEARIGNLYAIVLGENVANPVPQVKQSKLFAEGDPARIQAKPDVQISHGGELFERNARLAD